MSRRLFEDFLRPLLLVGLFAPAEELSAAVMIGTLYFYGTYTHVPSVVIHWAPMIRLLLSCSCFPLSSTAVLELAATVDSCCVVALWWLFFCVENINVSTICFERS